MKKYRIKIIYEKSDYDGYWGDGYNTIDEAITEALIGSKLI